MKRTILALSALIVLGAYLVGCGGSNTNPTTNQTSGLTKRAYITNTYFATVTILDASLDQFGTHVITLNGTPQRMALALDRSVTLVFNASGSVIDVVDNASETLKGTIQLPGVSDRFVALNNATGFASVRNAQAVEVLDLTNLKLSGAVSVVTPQQMTLSSDGKKLLVFSDTVTDSITVVDTTTATTNPAGAATSVSSPDFDHPIYGVFSNDNTKAYILSCGVECGGTQAKVTVIDMTTTPPTPGASVNVAGATVGLLNSTSLYVAGNTNSAPNTGVLNVVDTGSLTASAPVSIGDGFHRAMALDNHGHLFIGAKACSQLRCLTFYDTGSNTATVEVNPDPTQNGDGYGDVTGNIQPISGRDRLYLVQGGQLRIFDTTVPQALPPSQQLDAVGLIYDVLQVDP